jgi:hypothetical protein
MHIPTYLGYLSNKAHTFLQVHKYTQTYIHTIITTMVLVKSPLAFIEVESPKNTTHKQYHGGKDSHSLSVPMDLGEGNSQRHL